MKLHEDALKFAELSNKYRESVNKNHVDKASKFMYEIKNLVSFSAERIGRVFRVKLTKESGSIDKGRGVPMVALSMNKYIAKRGNMKRRDFTTFNPKREKSLHGINLVMDYSGSMWFGEDTPRDHTIKGLRRIHAQNFLALTLGVYLQRISKGQLKIAYTVFSETPITEVYNDVMNADWDTFIVHWRWGSHGGDSTSLRNGYKDFNNLMPSALRDFSSKENWFCNVYPREAFIESKAVFNNLKLKDFVNVIFTDGGMHRIAESREDRVIFLRKALKTVAESELSFAFILSQQERDFVGILKELEIKHSVVNEIDEYNDAFSYLFHLINEVKGV